MGAPPPPAAAVTVFGDRLEAACRYAELLAGPAVERGLVGPREPERIWERHLLNSAVVAELVPDGARVADVGSGAGLPGVPLALARPDLQLVLIEPMARRTVFLDEVVAELGLAGRVTVRRARAGEPAAGTGYDVVTARAVAPLERLAGWTMPMVHPGGSLVALKGASAQDELAALRDHAATLHQVGVGIVDPPATVVVIRRGQRPGPPGTTRRARRAKEAM